MSEVFKPGVKKYSMPKTLKMHQRGVNNLNVSGSLTVDGAVDINATTFDIDATDDIDIDTTDTTGGIAIGTAKRKIPVL